MKNKIYFYIMNQLIQYVIISPDNVYISAFFGLDDIEDLVHELGSRLTNDLTLFDKQVNLFIDVLSTIQHDMALPKMFIFNVNRNIQKELKELIPDFHKYLVIKNIKTNIKRYLDISLTLVPKSYAKVMHDITKKLKLYYSKTFLINDAYSLMSTTTNNSFIVLHDIGTGYLLDVNYGILYNAMLLDELNDINLSQALGILLAYFKVSKEVLLNMDLLIISDNPLEITTSHVNELKCIRLSIEDFYKYIHNNISKLKGFKL